MRLIVFLLRIVLGLNFFYFGLHQLWGIEAGTQNGESILKFAALVTASINPVLLGWASLVIGACLVLGFLTRFASIGGIALTVMSYSPFTASTGAIPFNPAQLASSGALVVVCFLILIFANAGEHFGLDRFIQVHLLGKHKKHHWG